MKIEVIVSKNPIIYEEVTSIVPASKNVLTIWIKDEEEIAKFLNSHAKIDLLIADGDSLKALESIAKKRLDIVKPFRIHKLVEALEQSRSDWFIYDAISKGIIYDEEASLIKNQEENIALTDKENALMRSLVNCEKQGLSKEEIQKEIWGYSEEAETSTIETYISRLRGKLPEGILVSKGGRFRLSPAPRL